MRAPRRGRRDERRRLRSAIVLLIFPKGGYGPEWDICFIVGMFPLVRYRQLETSARSSTVFLNQFDSSSFESSPNSRRVGKRHCGLPVDCFGTVNCR